MSEIGVSDVAVKDLKLGKSLSRRDAIKFGTQVALDKTVETAKGVTTAVAVTNGVEHLAGTDNPLLTDARKDQLMNTVAVSTAGAAIGADVLEKTADRRDALKAFFIGMAAKYLNRGSSEENS